MIHILVLALVVGALGGPVERFPHRVIGGYDARVGEFPYQVSIRMYVTNHHCGGSLLNENTILSASHCFVGFTADPFSVIAGSIHLSGKDGFAVKVIGLRLHEHYDSTTLHNDVSILRVARNIPFSSTIYPVTLESVTVGADVDCVLSGWGNTYPGVIPEILQRVNLRTMSFADCKKQHQNPILESQICTTTYYGTGACNGDSGGPLAIDGRQIGIVSWGIPCAVGKPDVFTRISYFYKWIQVNQN